MKNWKATLLTAAVASATVMTSVSSFAQSSMASPFGRATPEQQAQAAAADKAKLNALRAWDTLPAARKTAITAQMANLDQAQRLALLRSVPSLQNLSSLEMQALLDTVAVTVPLPSPVKAVLSLKSNPPVQLGSVLELTLVTEWVVTEEYRYFRTLSLYSADGTELNSSGVCGGLKENNDLGQTSTVTCTMALPITTANPTFYAVAGLANSTNPKVASYEFRSNNLTVPTSP